MSFRWLKAKVESDQLRLGRVTLQGWQLFMLFGLLAMGVYFLIPDSLPGVLNGYFATFNLLPIIAILLVRRRLSPAQRLAWYLIAGGLSFWVVGEYIWVIYNLFSHTEAPYPSISDILFQGYYPLVIGGVLLLARGRFKARNLGVLVDAAIVTSSVGSLTWNFFITPQLENSSLSFIQVVVSASLPLLDLLLLSVGVFYLLLPGKRTPSYYFLALSLFITLISDIFYGFALLSRTYYSGHPVTIGWMFAFIFWGATVLHPSRASLGELAQASSASSLKLGHVRFILLVAVSILGPGMFIVQQIMHVAINIPLLLVTSGLLFLLVITRLAVIVQHNELVAHELSIQAQRQAELALFSQTALTATSLNSLFADTVTMACRVLNTEFSTVLELCTDNNRQIFKWSTNNPAYTNYVIPDPYALGLFSGRVMAERRPLIIQDWKAQSEFKPTSFIIEQKIRSSLAVPVLTRESATFGVLLVHSIKTNKFTDSEATFLLAVASVVATAIERKQVEEALQQERDFALQVMNNMGQGLIVKDANRIIQFVNPAMAEMLGYTTKELFGRSMDTFSAPSNLNEILTKRNEGITSTYEMLLVRKDGSSFYASVTGVPVMKDGTLEKVILVITDITKRRLADEEMQKTLAKEKELSELKSRFVSATSHEFRTPLTAIMTSAELLEHYSQRFSEEKKLEILQRIQTSVKYMSHLLDDILIIGRADAGKVENNPVSLDLVAECRKALEEVKFELTLRHQVNFVVHGESVNGQVDPVLFKRILLNLLSNAIKYSPEGGVISLELTCEAEQDKVQIRVTDQGIGILPEDRQRLFEVFHRGKNVGTLSGTGLGLSIVKHSVDLQQGTIAVTSEPGCGTTFTVSLPLVPHSPVIQAALSEVSD